MRETNRLSNYLLLFSKEKLTSYVGEDLVDQLLMEWEEDRQNSLTKRNLADMLVKLNGTEILNNPEFRYDLLIHMESNVVDAIYEEVPNEKKQTGLSQEEKATCISGLPWNSSAVNLKFLQSIGVNDSVFQRVMVDNSVVTNHQSMEVFYELLDYQFIIKQRILNELNKEFELRRMLVHMPTGTGKTKTMMHTLVHYYNFSLKKKGLIIWLAHTTELLQQAYDTFCNVWTHLGNGTVTAYKVWGTRDLNVEDETYEGVMFCGIQKLQAIKQGKPEVFEKLVQDVRLLVFDEAHKAAAKETREVVESLMIKKKGMQDRSLVGLTATPGRTTLTSDENKLLTDMFERRIITIDIDTINKVNMSTIEYVNNQPDENIIRYFQRMRILSKIKMEQLTYSEKFSDIELKKIKTSMTNNGYVDFSKQALEIIGRNRSRNKEIMRKLRTLSEENVPTILFACSVSHAKLLSYMLSLENISNALVLGEMSPGERQEAIASFKDRKSSVNILINYEVLTTGFDSTNIRCVFITRPTQSVVLYSQMLGRGLRGPRMGGNEECLLIDIKDNLGRYDADMAFGHFDAYWNN